MTNDLKFCPVPECRAPLCTEADAAYSDRWGRCKGCDVNAWMNGELTDADLRARDGTAAQPTDADPAPAKRRSRPERAKATAGRHGPPWWVTA